MAAAELKLSESVQERSRALTLFTDRRELTGHFARYVHEEPPRRTILFFYGDGGNGKSLLLRFLQSTCCKRLDLPLWRELEPRDDAIVGEFIRTTEEGSAVPSTFLDFAASPVQGITGDLKQLIPALNDLRRQLTHAGFRVPRFDFALYWFLYKTDSLKKDQLINVFGTEQDFVKAALTSAITIPGIDMIIPLVKLIFKWFKLDIKFTMFIRQRQVPANEVNRIKNLQDSEIVNELPELLAEDLNEGMIARRPPARLVLFFDAQDAFSGDHRDASDYQLLQCDEWFRRLLSTIDRSAGIVTVVAGRKLPRWQEATLWTAACCRQEIDSQPVRPLSAGDAAVYLQRVAEQFSRGTALADPQMRDFLVGHTQIAPGEIHPLYLGLCVDIVLSAAQRQIALGPSDFLRDSAGLVDNSNVSLTIGTQLLGQLLRYVDQHMEFAIYALSACRSFNKEIYFALGEGLHFSATSPDFTMIAQFSFVWDVTERGQGWYRINSLIRRLARELKEPAVADAHQFLSAYYSASSNSSGVNTRAEAIYHANQVDWRRGIERWIQEFDEALRRCDYVACDALHSIRSDLTIEDSLLRGQVHEREAKYLAERCRLAEAIDSCRAAMSAYDEVKYDNFEAGQAGLMNIQELLTVQNDTCEVLMLLGDLLARRWQYTDAIEAYGRALMICDNSAQKTRNDVGFLVGKACTMLALADVKTECEQYLEASSLYEGVIKLCDSLASRAPGDTMLLTDKALAFRGLADVLQADSARLGDSAKTYGAAVDVFEALLKMRPGDLSSLNGQAAAIRGLADVHAKEGMLPAAEGGYKRAIAACDAALAAAPQFSAARRNEALGLDGLGDVLAEQGRLPEAASAYARCVEACDEILKQASGDARLLNNKGLALLRLGDTHAELGSDEDALRTYSSAREVYRSALAIAPDEPYLLGNQSLVFRALAELHLRRGRIGEAEASCKAAIQVCEVGLQRSPSDSGMLLNKAGALCCLAKIEAVQVGAQAAAARFEEAARACDLAGRVIPEPPNTRWYRNLAERGLNGASGPDGADRLAPLARKREEREWTRFRVTLAKELREVSLPA